MKHPFFSICMPVYQGADFIGKAIASLRNQSFEDWELIIVDNASTDKTWEIIQEEAKADSRIRIYRNESNLGMSGNWNVALSHVRGAWIGTLSADDIYLPEALDRIAEAAKDPQIALWVHAHYSVHSAERKDLIRSYDTSLRISMRELAEIFYLRGNIFGEISCYFVSRKALDRTVEGVGPDRSTADVDFWMRIALANPGLWALYSPEVLTETTIHEASESTRFIRMGQQLSDIFHFIDDFSSQSWPLAIRFKQTIRTLYCLTRYGGQFSRSQRRAALWSTAVVVKNLLLPPDDTRP